MQKSIKNAISNRYDFNVVKKVSGRYIGYRKPMLNTYGGGYQELDPVDMGPCEEYYWETSPSGSKMVMRDGKKIFGFGP